MTSKRTDAQKNRAHLLSVARRMVQGGVQELSFNELAKKAGVGVGTVYRHFENQRALLAGLVEAQLAQFKTLMAAAGAEKDPQSSLEALFRGVLALELESPVIAQMLSAPGHEPREVQAQVAALEATAEEIVNRARRAKVIRADVKPGDFRRLICGLERAVRSGSDPDTSADRYVDIVLAGLKT